MASRSQRERYGFLRCPQNDVRPSIAAAINPAIANTDAMLKVTGGVASDDRILERTPSNTRIRIGGVR